MNRLNGWREVKLKSICSLLTDGTHYSPKSKSGPYRYITSKNIRMGYVDLSNYWYISEEEHRNIYRGCPVEFGDVLLTKDGANTGNVALNPLKEQFSLLSSVAILRANQDTINPYLYQFLASPKGQYTLKSQIAGQAITRLTLRKIGQTSILLPPIEEQRKIVEILGAWDEAITLTERLIEAKQERKKGLMQQLLTGKVRFAGFEGKEWHNYEVYAFVNKEKSKFDSRKEKQELPCIELEHISQQTGKIIGSVPAHNKRSIKNRFEVGQILFGKLRPYLRKYAQPNFDGVCSSEIWVLSAKIKYCTNDFLFYVVQSHKFISAANVTSGTKMPRADWKYLSNIAFFLPSIEEQQRIATILQACDDEITLLQRKAAALRQQKKGLMQQLLTGKVRVKV